MNQLRKIVYSSLCAGSVLSTGALAFGQEINIGVACGGADQDVNVATRNAIDQNWLFSSHVDYVHEHYDFDEFEGWTATGGIGDPTDTTRPFHKYVLASTLVMDGIRGQQPPIRQNSFGLFEYDPSGLFVVPIHARDSEYNWLSSSKSFSACRHVNPVSGEQECRTEFDDRPWWVAGSTATLPPTYGRSNVVQLMNTIGNTGAGTILARNTGDGELIYACPLLDDDLGAAKLAETIVHENWHSMNEPSHTDCPGNTDDDDGACATAWAFTDTAPTVPREHNLMADSDSMDAYQTGIRFACDVTESPEDWVPLMTELTMNEVANELTDRNIFQNITDPVTGDITGLAPIACGAPQPVLDLVPGVDLCANGLPACVSQADCTAPNTCESGCCTAPIIVR